MRSTSMMMTASLALALVAAGMPASVLAQGQAGDPHHQATQAQPTAPTPAPKPPAATGQAGMGSGGMPMMAEMMREMMGQMMGQMWGPPMGMMAPGGADPFAGLPLERIEGRLAFIKAELAITDAQVPQWEASAAMLRASAAKLLAEARALRQAPAPTTALEKLDRLERIDTLLLEAIRACRTASTPLYAVLDDAQKRTADELMLGVMGLGQIGLAM